MTTAIVFSKNRACQLDLLLRSMTKNATDVFGQVYVIWKGDGEYAAAYHICQDEHLSAVFLRESDLRDDTLSLVGSGGGHIAFLMDDCVFYREDDGPSPEGALDDEDVLCFSPRLGLNTTWVYPLDRRQEVPAARAAEDGIVYWPWLGSDGDFGYPFSLDGNIFRNDDLLPLLHDVYDWSTPNTVEAALAQMRDRLGRPLMTSHTQSSLVGVPANRVGDSHVTPATASSLTASTRSW